MLVHPNLCLCPKTPRLNLNSLLAAIIRLHILLTSTSYPSGHFSSYVIIEMIWRYSFWFDQVVAPFALFYVNSYGELMPIAIQLFPNSRRKQHPVRVWTAYFVSVCVHQRFNGTEKKWIYLYWFMFLNLSLSFNFQLFKFNFQEDLFLGIDLLGFSFELNWKWVN